MPKDERICYSVGCSWWNSIHQAGRIHSHDEEGNEFSSALPCCPFCGSVLMEMENEKAWWASVNNYALKSGDDDYPNFILWIRGKCFTSVTQAKNAYLSRT